MLQLSAVIARFIEEGQPIQDGDPGFCGLEGKGFLSSIGDDLLVMDVTPDEVHVQVLGEENLMKQAWRLQVEVLEV